MGPLLLLVAIPLAIAFVAGLLALSAALERSVLSPKAMILSAARARRAQPEFAETFVAVQFERLLRDVQRG